MRSEFTVERIRYAVEFTESNEFIFYVDAANSEKVVYEMTPFERAFGDDPPTTVWTTTGAGHVFEVRRHVQDFIDKAIQRFRPFYFAFGANEAVKVRLYLRLAARLCKRHEYGFALGDDGLFRFTKATAGLGGRAE